MMRWICGMAAAALLFSGTAQAEEVKGKIVKLDVEKKVVTLKVNNKDAEYVIADDAKLPMLGAKSDPAKSGGGRANTAKAMTLKELAQRADFAKEKGLGVIVQVEEKSSKPTITEIKIDRGQKPSKVDMK